MAKNLLLPLLFSLVLLGLLAGCGTLPGGRGWGQDATLLPGWGRIKHAAWTAASSPHVWAPVGGAVLLQIGEADERLSDWAVENTPIFGSTNTASDASDTLMLASFALAGATVIATPSGNHPGAWALSKAKGFGTQTSALLLTGGTADLLKKYTGRTRPNGKNDLSFPSGHASAAAVNCMLAYQNTEYFPIPDWSKTTLKTGFALYPYVSGWARVEAGKHYPSDILFGTALGNFFAVFINEAFMGVESPDDLSLTVDVLPDDAVTVGLRLPF